MIELTFFFILLCFNKLLWRLIFERNQTSFKEVFVKYPRPYTCTLPVTDKRNNVILDATVLTLLSGCNSDKDRGEAPVSLTGRRGERRRDREGGRERERHYEHLELISHLRQVKLNTLQPARNYGLGLQSKSATPGDKPSEYG